MEKQKLNNKEKADEHKFKGGCGKLLLNKPGYQYCGKGLEKNLCPDCQAKKKIQKINEIEAKKQKAKSALRRLRSRN